MSRIFAVVCLFSLALMTAACSKVPEGGAPAANSSKSMMPADADTKALYIQSCYSCHSSGAAGAPRTGVAADWQLRLEQGMDTLLEHTISGFKGMPPLGMCMDCGEEEFIKLIRFMSGQE
jgi:cytochrome c5